MEITQNLHKKWWHHWQEIPFSRKFHRLSTQSDDVTSRDFQHIGKSLRLNLLFRTSQLRNFHNQENPMGIDNNSEDSFCCANANSTDDPRQFGELFTHGRVGEDGHTKSHLGDIVPDRSLSGIKRTSSIERSTLLWHRDESCSSIWISSRQSQISNRGF